MKPGELRQWAGHKWDNVDDKVHPFLVVSIDDDGSVTVIEDGVEYVFRHHDLETYSFPLQEPDHETG